MSKVAATAALAATITTTDLQSKAQTMHKHIVKGKHKEALQVLQKLPRESALETLAVAFDGIAPDMRGKFVEKALGFDPLTEFDCFVALGADLPFKTTCWW